MATKKKAVKKAKAPKKVVRKKTTLPTDGPVLDTAERAEPVVKAGRKKKETPLDLEERVTRLELINAQHGQFLKEE